MPAKGMYLVRNGRGRMATVQAMSIRGAIREYLANYSTKPGEELDVKRRGEGAWQSFRAL